MKTVQGLADLELLWLAESRITDAGLAELESLSGLKSLSLEKTSITDEGLLHLAGLKELVYLDVRGTKVTASGLSRLTSKNKVKHLAHDFPRIVPGVTIAVGERVPELSAIDLQGQSWKFAQLHRLAKLEKPVPVVLTFWCSFCPSCRQVEHDLDALAKKYAGKAIVVALDASAGETAEMCRKVADEKGLTLPILLDASGRHGRRVRDRDDDDHRGDRCERRLAVLRSICSRQGALRRGGTRSNSQWKAGCLADNAASGLPDRAEVAPGEVIHVPNRACHTHDRTRSRISRNSATCSSLQPVVWSCAAGSSPRPAFFECRSRARIRSRMRSGSPTPSMSPRCPADGEASVLAPLFPAAAGRIHMHVGDAEIALQRTLVDLHVLHVFKRDRRLMDQPDAAANPQAPAGHHIPGAVIAEVNGDVRENVGHDSQKQHGQREDGPCQRKRDREHQPADQESHVDHRQGDPEEELQVAQEAFGRTKRLQRLTGRDRQRRRAGRAP